MWSSARTAWASMDRVMCRYRPGATADLRPDERIVQTFTYDGFPDGVSLETAVFEDLGGRTQVTTKSFMDAIEARDAMLKSGMEYGVREGYERLDELLSSGRSGSPDRRTDTEA